MKNYISTIFYFLLIVIAVLGILSLIDSDKIKPFSLFSDIVSQPEETPVIDTVKIVPQEETYPCPDSIQCFENYTAGKYPLDGLISKLLSGKKQVRVAWFGDSFSEADIVVGDLRDTLQSLYGGNGVGFVPMAAEVAGFRRTVVHRFGGWHTRSFIGNTKANDVGIAGTVYRPDSSAYLTYASTKLYKHTRKFDKVRFFYTADSASRLFVRLNDQQAQSYKIRPAALPQEIIVNTPNTWRVAMSAADTNAVFYGASLEDTTGIYFDNYSIKGNSGLGLLTVRDNFLSRFNEMLHYDLIVLQFGLNVAEPVRTDYKAYAKQMTKVIEKLKRAFPNVPILLLSVSDRSSRVQGEYVTLAGVPALLQTQRKMAADNGLLFWNLFEAMGGMNSMSAFVSAKPPMANKDYTHLNYAGSRVVGLALAGSFIHEVDIYKKRNKQ